MLRHCSCFNEPKMRTRGNRPVAENAAHKDNDTYPYLKEGIVLLKSNLIPGFRHTRDLDAVGRTLNNKS